MTKEKLTRLITHYRSGLLSTPNIQVLEKKLYAETIVFACNENRDGTLSFSIFKNSELINMKFIKVDFVYSYFQNCLIQNCLFEDVGFTEAEFQDSVFKNCQFINCRLTDLTVTKTIFNNCRFLNCPFNALGFELSHFVKPIFVERNV